jgi:hypothetical protein
MNLFSALCKAKWHTNFNWIENKRDMLCTIAHCKKSFKPTVPGLLQIKLRYVCLFIRLSIRDCIIRSFFIYVFFIKRRHLVTWWPKTIQKEFQIRQDVQILRWSFVVAPEGNRHFLQPTQINSIDGTGTCEDCLHHWPMHRLMVAPKNAPWPHRNLMKWYW